MKENYCPSYEPPTREERIRTAERYWRAMRMEMNLAIEREQKAFAAYQESMMTPASPL